MRKIFMLWVTLSIAANTVFADTIQWKPLVSKDYLECSKKQNRIASTFINMEPYHALKNAQIKSQFFPSIGFRLRI